MAEIDPEDAAIAEDLGAYFASQRRGRPTLDPEYAKDPFYRAGVFRRAEAARSRLGTVGEPALEAVNSYAFGVPQQLGAAGVGAVSALGGGDFGRTYSEVRDAQEVARSEFFAERPTAALTSTIGGALASGYGLARLGGKLAASAGAANSPLGRAVQSTLTLPRGAGTAANVGRGVRNAAAGGVIGSAAAAGYGQDPIEGALIGAGAAVALPALIRAVTAANPIVGNITAGALGGALGDVTGAGAAIGAATGISTRQAAKAIQRILTPRRTPAGSAPRIGPTPEAAAARVTAAERASQQLDETAPKLQGPEDAPPAPKLPSPEEAPPTSPLDAGAKPPTQITEDDLTLGFRLMRVAARSATGSAGRRTVQDVVKPISSGSRFTANASASRALAALGGPKAAVKQLGATVRRLREAIEDRDIAIRRLNTDIAQRDRLELAYIKRDRQRVEDISDLRHDHDYMFETTVKETYEKYQEILVLREALQESEKALGILNSTLGKSSRADFAAEEVADLAARMDGIEDAITKNQNFAGVRDRAVAAAERETREPGVTAVGRAAFEAESAPPGALGRLFRPDLSEDAARGLDEITIARTLEERAEVLKPLRSAAERVLETTDPNLPGGREIIARARRAIDEIDALRQAEYPGADRITPARAARLQGAEGAPTRAPLDDAAVASLTSRMRATLDALGLKEVKIELVTEDVMRALTGQSARGATFDGTRILLNVNSFTADTFGHEVVHSLKELGLFTSKEWGALVRAARRKNGGPAAIKAMPSYKNLDDAGVDEELVARYLGPEIEAAANGLSKGTSTVAKMGRRVVDVGRQIRETLITSDIDPDDVLQRIGSGAVGSRMRSRRGDLFGSGLFDRANRRLAGMAAYADPKTVEARARADTADEFGVRLSRGQQSGDIGQLQQEDAFAGGAYGTGAQQTMEGFYKVQREQLEGAIGRVADDLGVGAPTSNPIDVMVEVVEGVARREQVRRGWGGRKYRKLEEAGSAVTFGETDSLVSTLRAVIDDNFLLPDSRAEKLVTRIERELTGPLSFKGFRDVRSKLLAAQRATAKGSSESYESALIVRALDDWFEDAIEKGNLRASGDTSLEKVISRLRDANQYWRKYKEAFGVSPDATNTEKKARGILIQMANKEIGVNELVRDIFGVSQVGGTELSERLLSQLERILNYRAQEVKQAGFFTDDYMSRMQAAGQVKPTTVKSSNPRVPSPEWQAIRAGAWRQLTEAPPGKNEYGYGVIADRIDKFLNGSGRGASRILYEPAEREQMKRFVEMLRAMDRQQKRGNVSGTSYANARWYIDVGQKILGAASGYFLGALTGVPGAGIGGAALGFGTGSPIARGIQSITNQQAAQAAVRGGGRVPSPVVEGTINWSKVRAALAGAGAAARIGEREISTPPAR